MSIRAGPDTRVTGCPVTFLQHRDLLEFLSWHQHFQF